MIETSVRAYICHRSCWVVLFAALGAPTVNGSTPEQVPRRSEVIRVPIVRSTEIRFRKLSDPQELSQVRVDSIVQDSQGFLWFGTWNGLNRYDGYKCKVFKHEPGNDRSLSGTRVYSLFRDHGGNLWIGTDQALDRFDPFTETFQHYRLDRPGDNADLSIVDHISEDSHGSLWLSTQNGLFRLDTETGRMTNYRHVPADPLSLGDNDIKSTGEDRSGVFWVATSRSLDEFDRQTGRVKRHIDTGESGVGLWFHEDRDGTFWIIYGSSGQIATLDRNSGTLIPYKYEVPAGLSPPNQAYAMLEDHDGTMWFGMAGGLMRFDRAHQRFVTYTHDPSDGDSIAENRVIALFEDREGNIWIGLHQSEPNFFRKKPLPFENLTRQLNCRDGANSGLVSAVFADPQGYLWLAVDRRLHRINRRTGGCSTLKEADNSEVLSIIGQGPDTLWFGNAAPGLLKYSIHTRRSTGYRHNRTNQITLCSGVIDQLLIARDGTLWAATWDGLCRFDAATQHFTTYKPAANARGLAYYSIDQGPDGSIWLGGNLGLHRFDPHTHAFKVWNHHSDSSDSISDNRVNAVFFDHSGRLWVGTQNGLDQLDSKSGEITKYDQRNGITGNAISCILEDTHGNLWMSTNKGISTLNTETRRFANYTVADGLPGPDLTGWGSCYTSAAGEMFFAGFGGATAFFPDRVEEDQFALPQTVLTDFRLFGAEVDPGPKSPLHKSINHAYALTLSHEQNIFSVGFSALSYLNPATNRYRYMLEGLDQNWNEVGSDRRFATYTTLPARKYAFRVEGATSRGAWDEPGAILHIEILPAWWNTPWFRIACLAALLLLLTAIYIYRKRLRKKENEQIERLRQAQTDLDRSSRVIAMGELAASLAHEIKQPIGAAVTNAEACLHFLDRDQPDLPEAHEAALEMGRDARRAADIIEHVRSLYRKGTSPREIVDVDEVIREMVVMVQKEANRHSVTLHTDLIEGLPMVIADRVQLQQVLMNLMLNGIEAMRDAGGELTIKSQLADDGQLLISVSDTGVGLPTGKETEIFNAFFTTKSQGTGLGLAITRSIVESHRGRVWATANSGPGATFQFTLPQKKAAHT
jgi:ligand-binding sensor domain-containing protein/signal transduction histidine kinase